MSYCNLDEIFFLVLFAMSFSDTQILIRKRGNIATFKPLSRPSLTQRARQTPPAALLMELKREAQIKCRRRRLGDIGAVHSIIIIIIIIIIKLIGRPLQGLSGAVQ